MKCLDTNVLVLYLTQDDREQARRADAFMEEALAAAEPLYLNLVVLCETVWVLRSAYKFDRKTVAQALDQILATAQFAIESREAVALALRDYRRGRGDFADYVIARTNALAGCEGTVTFDGKLDDSPLFRVL